MGIKQIAEAIIKNQGFSDLSLENKKIVEVIFKIKDVTKIKNSLNLLKDQNFSKEIENIFKTQDAVAD